ncbi:YjcZ family sporulation protein [Niallia circulans]|uniref:YjcZ family sporulation protein n=1 Tax=Niallia circulans TaxID=1397 RepID=UPI002848880D|nr:YjcZ family sporulation protein [Niallia circulans]
MSEYYGGGSGYGRKFAFIVVFFILFIIVGGSFFGSYLSVKKKHAFCFLFLFPSFLNTNPLYTKRAPIFNRCPFLLTIRRIFFLVCNYLSY